MGVISNSDFGDADDNWIYDKYPTTENASTNLNLYAKWTPLKTHIILDASGASNGTNGEAWVEYDNTKLTTITSVEPIQTTTTHVLGYFTEPDCHGADNGVMVLTSTGNFVVDTTTTNAPYQYFRSTSAKKWYKYNTQNEDTPLEIKLYAHYVVDVDVPEIKAPTDVYVDYTMGSHPVNGSSYEYISVAYGTTKTDIVPPKSLLKNDEFMGLYVDKAGFIQVAYNDGRLVESQKVKGFVENGKWICTQATATLYAKWSMKVGGDLYIIFDGNGYDGDVMVNNLQAVKCDGSEVTLFKNMYTDSTRTFIGWNTKADGTGIWYGDEYSSTKWEKGEMTLYAQWAETSVSTSLFMPVNYVAGDCNAFIDTNIVGNASHVFAVAFRIPKNNGSLQTVFAINNSWIDLFYRQTDFIAMYGDGGAVNSSITGNLGMYMQTENFSVAGGTFTREDGQKFTLATGRSAYSSAIGDRTYYLYMFNASGYESYAFIYRFKISLSGNAVMNLIPCKLLQSTDKASDGETHNAGEIGFWDLVTDKFYGNTNTTGSFSCELN